MAYHKIADSICSLLFIFCVVGLQGCTKDSIIEVPAEEVDNGATKPEKVYGTIQMAEKDLTPDVFKLMLQNDEPDDILFDSSQRSFRVDQPLQVSINEKQELLIRFFSPRPIKDVMVWATINGYEETFILAKFDVIPGFTEFHKELPILTQSKRYISRSGKEIEIMANPYLSAADFKLEIECDDAYYQKLLSTQSKFSVRFSPQDRYGVWRLTLLPSHAREAVAMMLNYAYMFSSQEFADELEKYRGKLHSNNNKAEINIDALRKNIINYNKFVISKATGYDGMANNDTYALNEWCFLEHYADDGANTTILFHELGHALGYKHEGNMTYEMTGPGWTKLCGTVYKKLCIEKKLPIYSRRFMHTRRNGKFYESSRYKASANIIEDPELDAIDGGLSPIFKEDDENTTQGTPLPCTISYQDIPGATKSTFAPKDVCVYGNRIYIVNDATGNFSLEILEEQNGQLVHVKSLKEWTEDNATKGFAGPPNGVTVAHGRIYVTNEKSRTDIFDDKTFELVATIGTGAWGEGSNQTVHAFDVLVYRGCVFIRDKKRVCTFMENDIIPGVSFKNVSNYCRTFNMGEEMVTHGQAIGSNGLLYTTQQANNKIHVFDPATMREQKEWKAEREINLSPRSPYDIAFVGKRMFVTFVTAKNQPVALAEVNPETGAIVKDYTTAGGHTFGNAEKMSMSRQTLFVIDRKAHTVTGIPMDELN
ncbi:hypothetical protein [uncultured Bacteroides sp.]|uniref:hypothetical protein n=1 Tax=uncultured Bacteroides sp. TaxID=162156 RepID=UPI0025D57211|nr:hypothetical protein [uncultured Bacteroides sp.]